MQLANKNNPLVLEQPQTPLFLLTIDTEEEWNWDSDLPRPPFSTKNIEEVPEFQRFCSDLSIIPTYFVDYAVVNNVEHAEILAEYFKNGQCDIGAHLHPWANPPIEETICDHNSHAINLDLDLFRQKITKLTERLSETFGAHPYSYRAGRWGINAAHMSVLASLGYRVDSSVRPFYFDTSFSYVHAITRPYWPSLSDILKSDESQTGILEVPVTSGYNRKYFELCEKIHTHLASHPLNKARLIGMLWRTGIMRKITVTPEGYKSHDIKRCIDMAIARGDQVINMFIHSSDLLPGCTSYVRTKKEKDAFMMCIRDCVEHIRLKHNAEFTTMREIRKQLTGSQ